jgi:LCP family protein required for cell wall assembly
MLVALGAVLTVLSSAALVGGKVLLDRYTSSVDQQHMLGAAAVSNDSAHNLDGPLNVLLVGVDERTVQDDPEGTRADSIVILHIDAAHHNAYLLSVPRDTLVDIPAFARSGFRGSREKINAAFQHGSDNGGGRGGGFELLATTVSNLTGLHFDAGAIINFAGFKRVVEALGGVRICVDQKVTSIHLNTNGTALKPGQPPATYQQGCQKMVAWQALDFVRQRHTAGGDYDRQRHQQQFLKAIGKAATGKGMLTNPAKMDSVVRAAGQTLTVDPGNAKLTDWVQVLGGIGTEGMIMLKTNGGQYASVKCPDGSSCQSLTADSLDMFAAAGHDDLLTFITAHPDWVATDGTAS